MSKLTDKEVAIAQVYSQSMLELATTDGRQRDLLDELRGLADLAVTDGAFAHFLGSPMVDGAARSESLEKLLRGKASDLLVNALQVMGRKGRLGLLPVVAETYRKLLQEQEQRVDVEVKTAVPLSDSLRDQIRQSAGRFAGLEADLTEVVEPGLIGGMVVRVGDRKIDTSIRSHLGRLRARLDDRAGRELHGDYFEVDPAAS